MYILALETTDKSASVAVFDNENQIYSTELNPDIRSAQTLAPGIDQALHCAGITPADVKLVAVTQGPGSFTGLRVGVVTAKTFAWAVNADIIGVDTLECVANEAPENVLSVSVAFDCQRGQVIYRNFNRDESGWFVPSGEETVANWQTWLEETDSACWLSGPYVDRIDNSALSERNVVPAALRAPTAVGTAKLAWRLYQSGRKDDLMQLLPHYSRPAAAEEKRLASNK